jgi:hypothetical protein
MNYDCRYPACGRTFSTRLGRSAHERWIHGKVYVERETDFKCPYCGKPLESEMGFQIHLEKYHQIPSKTLDWVEKRSFENLVYLYSDELHKINSNRVIGEMLDEKERSKLIREGVLEIEELGRMGKKTIYSLSDEALKILKDIGYDREGY